MQAARHVDGDHVQRVSIEAIDQSAGDPVDRTRQAGAEQRIVHQRTALQEVERRRCHLPCPALGRPGRVALQRCAVAHQGQPHWPALGQEMPGGDETVPAIVARSAQHDDGPRLAESHHGVGDGPSCPLHEIAARHAAGDGNRIGAPHLGAAQENEIVARLKITRLGHWTFGCHGARVLGAADRN